MSTDPVAEARGPIWKPDICIYHAHCADGFGAAWAVRRRWPAEGEVRFHPASYGDAPPDVTGLNVLIVDFSYPRADLEEMAAAAGSIILLDHHASAERTLLGFNHAIGATCENAKAFLARSQGAFQNVLTHFDMASSGATMAWRFCHGSTEIPLMLQYVEDRDLWRFWLATSRQVNAFISSYPLDFAQWQVISRLVLPRRDFLDRVIEIGEHILMRENRLLDDMLAATTRRMTIGGHDVPSANVPPMFASEAGNRLSVGEPFAATFFDDARGDRKFSLRSASDGLDVSVIAQGYGGGGHRHAAGFTVRTGSAFVTTALIDAVHRWKLANEAVADALIRHPLDAEWSRASGELTAAENALLKAAGFARRGEAGDE